MSNNLINIHSHFTHKTGIEIIQRKDNNLENNAFFSAGIHPKDSDGEPEIPAILNDAENPRCLAIGEIGLDKIISTPLAKQLAIFESQLRISETLGLPVILHCVKAWNEVLQVRRQLKPHQPWIFHGFRKTSLLPQVLDEGLMISIGTAVLHDVKLQQIVPQIPDNRLFLETDDDQEHTIQEVYAKVAGLKRISMEELEKNIMSNFTSTFSSFKPL